MSMKEKLHSSSAVVRVWLTTPLLSTLPGCIIDSIAGPNIIGIQQMYSLNKIKNLLSYYIFYNHT